MGGQGQITPFRRPLPHPLQIYTTAQLPTDGRTKALIELRVRYFKKKPGGPTDLNLERQ